MTHLLRFFFVLLMVLAGCHPLASGSLEAVGSDIHLRCRGNVFLVRGWRDLWSGGIDVLANQIRGGGMNAQVYRASQWHELAEAIERRYGSATPPRPLVLIGFSYGADDVLRIAGQLGRDHIAVDLLITIDPVTPPPVPGNVVACYNYFQTNGIWDVFPWLRGIPLRASRPGQLMNVDIRRDRPDLLLPDLSHATIAGDPKLQREIAARVMELCR